MRPQDPKPGDLRRKHGKLLFHRPNNGAGASISSKEGGSVLALYRIEWVALREETMMYVKKSYRKTSY